jgi:hypothetical protein
MTSVESDDLHVGWEYSNKQTKKMRAEQKKLAAQVRRAAALEVIQERIIEAVAEVAKERNVEGKADTEEKADTEGKSDTEEKADTEGKSDIEEKVETEKKEKPVIVTYPTGELPPKKAWWWFW